jgi:hypothetical protein
MYVATRTKLDKGQTRPFVARNLNSECFVETKQSLM